jgi:DNA helicase-2/ATP-dependent DNA helicase PcrA
MERPRGDAAPSPASPQAAGAFEQAVSRLTDAQRAAVEHPSVPLCIVAGAGSGKTNVLTLRVAHRIRSGSATADHTAVCTFTRKAANELRGRLIGFGVPVSTSTVAGRVPTPGVRAGTVHQLALNLIRRHCLDTGRDLPVIVEHRGAILRLVAGDPATASELASEIAWAKARGLGPDEYGRHIGEERPAPGDPAAMVEGFRAYQAALDRRHGLDLDDLLIRSADLLEDDDRFAERMRWRYRHLSVDEFQDVNPAQFRLIRSLLGQSRDLCVVGDPHQAIYGWNGADPTLLDRLPDLLGPFDVLNLVENHRSTPQIVAAADAVLGGRASYRARSVLADGPSPTLSAYENETAEAEGVAGLLFERFDEGVAWSQQAVLARTHDQLAAISKVLERSGIPHRLTPPPERLVSATGSDDVSGDDSGDGRGKAPGVRDAVELATFHRAKGAEWSSVCVTGIEDGFVPIVYAVEEDSLAEERRLLHVALSRAARHLACSWARQRTMGNGRVVERQPSPWLEGAGLDALSAPGSRGVGGTDGATDQAPRQLADLRAALMAGGTRAGQPRSRRRGGLTPPPCR